MFAYSCSIFPSVAFYNYNFLILFSSYTCLCFCHYDTSFLLLFEKRSISNW